jgi:integrase
LRRSSGDLLHGTLHITHALKEVAAEPAPGPGHRLVTPSLVLGPTKTHQARQVSLPQFLIPQLTAQLASRPADPDVWLFTTPNGHPVRHNLFYKRALAPAAQQALPANPPRWHDLSHTHASMLIASGASIVMVSKRLGHASTRTTLDTYGHYYPSEETAMAPGAGQAARRGPPERPRAAAQAVAAPHRRADA